METNTPLYDIEIEDSVLGAIMSYSKALDDVRELICEECFTTLFNKEVYRAVSSLSQKGEPIDVLSVTTELKRLGSTDEQVPFNVVQLASKASGNYYYNAQVLLELYSRSKAWETGQRLAKNASDLTFDLTDTIEQTNEELSDIFNTPSGNITTVMDAANDLYTNHIERNMKGDNMLTGSPTGFGAFDIRSGGLQPGNLIIVAAETSQGKTSFALNSLVYAAKHGHPAAVYSMEMSKTELAARMLSGVSRIPCSRLLYSVLTPEEMVTYNYHSPEISGLPIYFDDKTTSNIDVILSSIRTMAAKRNIKGAVVDYLQILNVNMKGTNKEQQMGEVARRLKNLARELNIWIMALSQLRRDNLSHVPTLNRLRDSGQIEEAADIVVLLYRPEVYNQSYPEPFSKYSTKGTAMVDIAKGRNIGLTKFLVGFDALSTRFYEYDFIPEREAAEEPF